MVYLVQYNTWNNFVLINSSAVNPVRGVLQRCGAPAWLVLIQVHILGRPWTNDQIFCRAIKWVSRFYLENTALKRIKTLSWQFCRVSSERSDLGAAYLTSRVRRKGRTMLSSRPRRQTFSLRLLFFLCCFDVAGLILCYGPPQGTMYTEGLREDELGQDQRHTPQQRLQHNSNTAERPSWLLAYFSVHSGIHPSSSGMHHHRFSPVSGLSKE